MSESLVERAAKDSRLRDLASAIERDMLSRGLEPGDRYLVAEEVGQVLSVSRITANRAMQWLAEQGVLVRARSAGTFVGPKFRSLRRRAMPQVAALHVVMPMDYARTAPLPLEVLVRELAESLPGTDINLHYLADYDRLGSVRKIVDQLARAEETEAIILVGCDQAVQQAVVEAKIPAVVFGTVFPGLGSLSSLDVDMSEAGRLMVRYALDRGAERLLVIFRQEWLWGDNLLLNAVMDELSAAGRGITDIAVRSLGPARDLVEGELEQFFDSQSGPAAVLCVGDFYAEIARDLLNRRGAPHPVELISAVRIRRGAVEGYARVVARVDGLQQVKDLVQLLKSVVQEGADVRHVKVPVEIRETGQPDYKLRTP